MAVIVISEFMDDDAVASLKTGFDVKYDPALVDDPKALAESLSEAEALIVRNRTQVTDDLLRAGTKLRAIGRLGVGLDNIDLKACNARGVTVYPATGANNGAVVEYVLTTAMMLLRGAYHLNDDVISGQWPRNEGIGYEIDGKVLGLVGFGGIAREAAAKGNALGMTVLAHDPFLSKSDPTWATVQRKDQLNDLLSEADIISIHVPLTTETRNLIDRRALSAMKASAIVINTSRGGVVDEEALVVALKSQKLGGAALDVFAGEPVDNEAGARFAGTPNLILTPHIAGVTVQSNVRVSRVTADNIRRHLEEKT